jgi:hypothetical protein
MCPYELLVYSSLASYDQHRYDTTSVTLNFKAKTECIPLCVPESYFLHKATNSEIKSITSVHYIEYYYYRAYYKTKWCK